MSKWNRFPVTFSSSSFKRSSIFLLFLLVSILETDTATSESAFHSVVEEGNYFSNHHEDLSSSSSSSSSYLFSSSSSKCGSVFSHHLNANFGHQFASSQGDLPFIVQITLENSIGIIKSKCVGSLLTESWILTSADCGLENLASDSNLTYKVTHFDLDFDHWSSTSFKKNQNVTRQTINVTDIHLTSITKSCSPMLLKLQSPLVIRGHLGDNNVCLPPDFKIRDEWKGIASGWSSYGDSVIERYLRVTQVSVKNQHCLSPGDKRVQNNRNYELINSVNSEESRERSDDDDTFCVSYLPQVHFYLLPGSPLLTIHESSIILLGVSCSNLTSNLINSSYIYRQTYARVSQYLDVIGSTIESDGNSNALLTSSASVQFQIYSTVFNLFHLFFLVYILVIPTMNS